MPFQKLKDVLVEMYSEYLDTVKGTETVDDGDPNPNNNIDDTSTDITDRVDFDKYIEKAAEAQSILFPKEKFTVEQARVWLKSHKKHSGKVDSSGEYHRFRQFEPSECATEPRTISFGDSGIKAVVCNRGKSKMHSAEIDVYRMDEQFSKGLVYGIVYSPNILDSHGDFTSAEEIENAAHNFLPAALSNPDNWTNINHSEVTRDVDIVESYIAPIDFILNNQPVTKGSWILVARVNNPELKQRIANGEITGFSLEGHAFSL